ncbi:hypothetical protein BVRB_5g124580 [Beta vulgaris subsp. vulgaris]|nr:hypothetical protein BVRB_5g124580 [Beta vulgaris subsp. vulgaris]
MRGRRPTTGARRSAYRLLAIRHPTGAHRRPPSASVRTISSTL